MAQRLTLETINRVFQRTLIPPPREILIPLNTTISMGNGPYKDFAVLGMHKVGENRILVNGSSPQLTLLHEAVHNMGIHGETPTRILAAISNFRANFGILPMLMPRHVQYDVEEVPESELNQVFENFGLEPAPGVQMVRLVLRE